MESASEPDIVVASCVGGGPMARLVEELSRCPRLNARVLARYQPTRWRTLMAGNSRSRMRARLGAFVVFSLTMVVQVFRSRPTTLIVTTNPFPLPWVGVATRWIHRSQVVILVYDLYPDAFISRKTSARGGLLAHLAAAMNRYCFHKAAGVVFIGSQMASHAREHYGEPRRWTVLETGAVTEEFSSDFLGGPEPTSALERWCDERVVISYVGNLGHVHDWDTVAAAMPQVLDGLRGRVGVAVAGSGPGITVWEQAWRRFESDGSVRFEAPLSDQPWARLLARSDIALVTLRQDAAHTSIPSKTFSAMAAGNAIIAIAPRGSDLSELVLRHDCGIVVEPGDIAGTVEALQYLIRNPIQLAHFRSNACGSIKGHYDLPLLATRWARFLTSLDDTAR